jgi:predicted small lipoprotein YifL
MNARRTLLAVVLALFTLGACGTPGTLASAPLSAQQADLLAQW